jgi:hypothetical protein
MIDHVFLVEDLATQPRDRVPHHRETLGSPFGEELVGDVMNLRPGYEKY